MTDLNDVLERVMTDPGFRQQLKDDPASALAGYDLDDSELKLLRAQISEEAGAGGSVEQRTSKSALGGALFGLLGSGGSTQEAAQYNQSDSDFAGSLADHDEVAGDRPTEEVAFYYNKVASDDPGEGYSGEVAADEVPESEMKVRFGDILIGSSQVSGGSDVAFDDADLSQPSDADQPARRVSLGDVTFNKLMDGSTPGSDGDADHLVAEVPPGADQAPTGKVEYTWKIEEGVKVVDPDGGDLATPDTDPEGAEAPGIPKGPFVAESYSFGTSRDSGGLRSEGELVQAVSDESNQDILVGRVTPEGASDEPDQPLVVGAVYTGENPPQDDGIGSDHSAGGGQLGLLEFQATSGPDAAPGVLEDEAASGEQQGEPEIYEYPGEYPSDDPHEVEMDGQVGK